MADQERAVAMVITESMYRDAVAFLNGTLEPEKAERMPIHPSPRLIATVYAECHRDVRASLMHPMFDGLEVTVYDDGRLSVEYSNWFSWEGIPEEFREHFFDVDPFRSGLGIHGRLIEMQLEARGYKVPRLSDLVPGNFGKSQEVVELSSRGPAIVLRIEEQMRKVPMIARSVAARIPKPNRRDRRAGRNP